ncbi:MAG: quiA [Caulobacteraceae bacterium]|nr:quiA [Caulobacteraceae bacterium]
MGRVLGQVYLILVALLVVAFGAVLMRGGAVLMTLGGSAYYFPAGTMAVVAGMILLVNRKIWALWIYAAFLAITSAWALWEAGPHFWPLAGRLGLPAVLGALVAFCAPLLPQTGRRRAPTGGWVLGGWLLIIGVLATFAYAFQPIWLVRPARGAGAAVANPAPMPQAAAWTGFGRTAEGTQFAPFDQITAANVAQLKVAWTFRSGDIASGGKENQNTPLQVGERLYACSPSNKVFALEAATGKVAWSYDPQVGAGASPSWQRCRSLAYKDFGDGQAPAPAQGAAAPVAGPCQRRIYLTTADMRLIALDADDGKPCAGFGADGQVMLSAGMGPVVPGFYNPTSGPVVAGDNLIVGGWVMDNQAVDEPSGVVRAFDARTGAMAWAFDIGRPGVTTAPAAGETYTRGTPNMWSTPTYDAALGLVFLPMGNATPDMYGGQRSAATEEVGAAIVALDARTGARRWVFQTTHHDIWDYDLPSKPVLYDAPDDKGGRVPALIQTTKRGEIFMLDRRDGKPIAQVVEKPAPSGGLPGERLSPTQPYSVGMPEIRQGALSEAGMWGITPIDQLYCRIAFKRLKYQGDFTPPSTDWYLPHPSPYGTMNWGGISIDPVNDYLIVNDMRIMMKAKLIPRDGVDQAMTASGKKAPSVAGVVPMAGTPYGAVRAMVTSLLGVPCTAPPFGAMTAIDLNTRKIAWQRSLGTPKQIGPLGHPTGMTVPIGLPSLGGPVATKSGLIFYSGTADYFLRAMDVRTGREVWKSPLPVGAQSTPLVFSDPATGKEYVVVTAGGGRTAPDRGDYVIAYALPAPPP